MNNDHQNKQPFPAVVSASTGSLDYFPEKETNIFILRLTIYLNGQSYADGKDIKADYFYHWMKNHSGKVPETSPPNIGETLDFFYQLHAEGWHELLVITPSAGMSETKKVVDEAALLLKNKLKIHIFDSGTSAIAEGMMAQKAAKWLRSGLSIDETIQRLSKVRDQSLSIVCISTLNYLVKKKKISIVSGLLGNWLQVCPILQFTNGQIQQAGKVRTTENAHVKVIELIEKSPISIENSEVYTLYCGNKEIYNSLDDKLTKMLGYRVPAFPLSPTVGAFSGPDAVGVAILPKE